MFTLHSLCVASAFLETIYLHFVIEVVSANVLMCSFCRCHVNVSPTFYFKTKQFTIHK